VWLYLANKTDLFDGRPKKVLHVAPERCLQPLFSRSLGQGYLTADLAKNRAMVQMDITKIDHADGSFDVIYCSHVLEHVLEDRQAMREFYRVLRPGGWAILLVPITVERTFEDPTIVSPRDRLRVFGQEDHVRRYGPDFVDRLRETGFDVRTIRVQDLYGQADAIHMGLTAACGDIYHCTKV
jgi:SAM-dependent methyltransferase